jgi:predicted Zn finger-like uncharacterized protein
LDFDDRELLMYVTLCPECDTSFKVSDEQLAQANGWVRCGRCGAVFDGLLQIKKAQAQDNALPVTEADSSDSDSVSHEELAGSPFVKANSAVAEVDETNKTWWVALSVFLSVVLLCQFLLLQRDRLAAEEPSFRPFLAALCVPFRCKVQWPMDADFVKIENSNFNFGPHGSLILQARLKNTQLYPVGMPYLDLILTDYQDQTVVRKVFSPEQMGVDDHLGPMRDARVTLNFSVDGAYKVKITGFKASIFYP